RASNTRYVQVVNLGQGASIKLPYGPIVKPGTGAGPYGDDNPFVQRQSLQAFWNNFSKSDPRAFCVSNGEFFSTNVDPTPLAFSLKANGVILSDGYAVNTE